MIKQIIDNDEKWDIVNKLEEEDRTIEGLKKGYPNEIEKLKEALLNYMGENDLKFLKTEFPDKLKYPTIKLPHTLLSISRVSMIIKKKLTFSKKRTSSVNLKMIILMMKK